MTAHTPLDVNTYPLAYGFAVTPSDSTVFSEVARALYIGVAGDVTVRMARGQNNLTFKAVPVGKLDIAVDKVMATGTAATNILALGGAS